MTKKRNYVRYINLQNFLFLLQLTNNVFSQVSQTVENGSAIKNRNIESGFINDSIASGNDTGIVHSLTSENSVKTANLSADNEQIQHNSTLKDSQGDGKDNAVRNESKSLQFDSNKEKETAHIHIYTGVWFVIYNLMESFSALNTVFCTR